MEDAREAEIGERFARVELPQSGQYGGLREKRIGTDSDLAGVGRRVRW